MLSLRPQYVVDENQQTKAVLLSIAEWKRIVEALEELDDILAYDEGKSGKQETIPFEQAIAEIQEGWEK